MKIWSRARTSPTFTKFECAVLLLSIGAVLACGAGHGGRSTFALSDVRYVAPDGSAVLELEASIPAGWQLYGPVQTQDGPTPLSVTVVPDGDFAMAGTLLFPPADRAFDPILNIEKQTYRGSVHFKVPVRRVSRGHGRARVRIAIHASACTARMCMPPTDDTLVAMLNLSDRLP